MAGPGEHPSGGIEGKQSRNPDRTEAQEDPERPQERRISESHHHCQVGQRIQAEPYHCAAPRLRLALRKPKTTRLRNVFWNILIPACTFLTED